jgi:hypothetical protein
MAQGRDAYSDWIKIFPGSKISNSKSASGKMLKYAFYFKEHGVDVCIYIEAGTTLNYTRASDQSPSIMVNGTFYNIVTTVFLHSNRGEARFNLDYREDELLCLINMIAVHEIFNHCDACPKLEPVPNILDNSDNVCVRDFDGKKIIVIRGSGESEPVDHLINELWENISKKSISLSDADRKKILDIMPIK